MLVIVCVSIHSTLNILFPFQTPFLDNFSYSERVGIYI